MNAKILVVVAICAALGGPLPAQQSQAQRATAGELPAAVQRALADSSKGEPVKTINRRVIDGRTVYDIELERDNAINPRFRITEDGIVIAGIPRAPADPTADTATTYDGIGIPATAFDPMMSVDELPAAVRETVKREAAGRPIADIDRETWQGRTVYEVEFKASGRNPQIHIAEDGTIVRGEESRGGQLGTSIRSLFLGTQLEDTPPAVQTTIRREARDRAIRDIDMKTRRGQRIYKVEIDDGRTAFQIQVADDGRILHDTRPDEASSKRG